MKDVNINIDNPDDLINEEKSTVEDIEVSEFNPECERLELKEDLDEKTISYIEREIRTSYEYKKYLNYLKTELDLTKCSLLPNIDCSDGAASLEFHHYPINLFEITEIVGTQMIETLGEHDKISCFDIAERVMEEHYKGNVGLVPLTKTLHEMAHNRSIIVPITKVNGNYKAFLKKYDSYIPTEIKDRITDAETTSISDDAIAYNNSKLEKNIVKYNITYLSTDEE